MADESQTPHPNDRFFRAYIGRPRHARELLRWQLPEELSQALNWRTMRVSSTTFIDERLRKRESDLLVEFRAKSGDPVLVYVLWEHQSNVDPMMAWRVLCYRVEIWKQWLAENPKSRELPFIHTMVLHQGRKSWNAALNFGDLIAFEKLGLPGPPDGQRVFAEYGVVPVVELPKLGWPEDLALRLGLSLMRAVTLGTQTEWLVEQGLELNELLHEPSGEVDFRIVIEYIFIADGDEQRVVKALEKTPPEIEGHAMTVLDKIEERGEKRGLERGEKRGLERGEKLGRTQLVSTMLRNGLSAAEIVKITELPLSDVKRIERDLENPDS